MPDSDKTTDAKRGLMIDSPFGEDLLCRSFSGNETIGRLFEYRLGLVSKIANLQFKDIVGKIVTVTLDLPKDKKRHFNGYVTEFKYLGMEGRYALYQAIVKPWLWFLTRTADCRIFQNKTVPQIIEQVFKDNNMSDYKTTLGSGWKTRVYCVQYRETDFNFISRLMEQEGIFYYFQHEAGKHTLVLVNDAIKCLPYPGYDKVPYFPPDAHEALRERDHIQQVDATQAIMPAFYTIKDFDFEKPKVSLLAKEKSILKQSIPIPEPEIFDYPGDFKEEKDGKVNARTRMEELEAQVERVHASGSARGMCAGYLFTLEDCPRADLNKKYLTISVTHEIRSDPMETSGGAGAGDYYSCQLEVMDSKEKYRSVRITPKPIVQGPQTAIVVGPKGQEIHCDKYARVKVQFHWDRLGKKDENSSCWVRVSQLWAGKGWGGIHIPRIGQEVLVSFLEGDPDQPLITGRVYNANQMPPYDLPEKKTQSGIKSRSTMKGSDKDFNEFRFEDEKDQEEIYLHAEKDLTTVVENHEHRTTYNTRKTIVGSEKNARPTETIETVLVHGTRIINVHGDDGLVVLEGEKGRKVRVQDGNYDLEVEKGDYLLTVTQGNAETKIERGSFSLTTGGDTSVEAGGDISMDAKGKVTVTAIQSIELKVAGSSIKIDPMGVTIKGPLIKVEASGINTITGALVKIN